MTAEIDPKGDKFTIRVIERDVRGRPQELFRILADGKIERGPAFTTVDAMSLKFWDLLEEQCAKHPLKRKLGKDE